MFEGIGVYNRISIAKSGLYPDFVVGFVMKASKAIKTGVYEDFFLESIVNYGNSKKLSKY